MRKYLLGAAGLLFLATPALALDSETRIAITGDFAESADISGIACADAPGIWPRNCLVAVDEGLQVQRATLSEGESGYVLTPGDRLALFGFDGDAVKPPFIGMPPTTACPEGVKKASELDAEGVAFAGGAYYVTGSHGCGRNNHAARLSAFLVARFAPDAAKPAEISFRLGEVLGALPELANQFGKDLDTGGISIEGLAALGDPARLYFGLRSPTDGVDAYLVSVDAAALFTAGADLKPSLATIDLSQAGTAMGIRDLATVDGEPSRLLLLIGPATGEGGPYAFADYDVADGWLGPVSPLATPAAGKAEAVLLVDRLATKAKLLFLHDGVANGAPTMDILALH